MQETPIRLGKVPRLFLEREGSPLFRRRRVSSGAVGKHCSIFHGNLRREKESKKFVDDMIAHAFVLVVLYVIRINAAKFRGLWHTFGCSTDDERCVRTRVRQTRVRTPKTRPGLDTRVPGCDVWAVSSSGCGSTTDRWRGAREFRQ